MLITATTAAADGSRSLSMDVVIDSTSSTHSPTRWSSFTCRAAERIRKLAPVPIDTRGSA